MCSSDLQVGGRESVIAADHVVICAGQEPLRDLQAGLQAAGCSVHLIGGADKAVELDAKRAIKQGTELAIAMDELPGAQKPAAKNQATKPGATASGSKTAVESFTTLRLAVEGHVATVHLNRPDKANAMNLAMWHELRQAFDWIDTQPEVRVAVLRGEGKQFCAGIDLEMMMGLGQQIQDDCDGRTRENLRRVILDLQDCLSSLERCRKPVLAAIHGACVGGGIDLVCCADMRYCSSDATFSIKEIDLGMTADVGTLQRLPKLISEAMVRELAFTGRRFDAHEALGLQMVNKVFESPEALQQGVAAMAAEIAAKSPLAIRGIKEMLNYARDHSVADGLRQVATWNAAMLMSADLQEAVMAKMGKRKPEFKN